MYSAGKESMEQILISVIVPVFNVERYLKQCVESIIAQSYTNIEILLVDDGSTDDSGDICDEFCKRDRRIKAFHKENGGLSDARNYGMKLAKGEVISFVDSDDYLSPFFIEIMYKVMQEGDCDIVALTRGSDFFDGKECAKLDVFSKDFSVRYCSTIEAVREMFYMKIATGAPFKLYKKVILNGIEFPYGYYYEDVATTYKAFLSGKNAAIVNGNLYAYRKRNDSIIRQEFSERKLSALKIFDEILNNEKIKSAGLLQAAKARVYSMLFSVFLQVPVENKELRVEIWKKLNTVRRDILTDKSGLMRKKNRYAAILSYLGMNIAYYVGKKFGQRGTILR